MSSRSPKLHDGATITRPQAPDGMLAGDVSHSHASAVKAYDNGKMDGFDLIVPTDPMRPYVYFAESQIPNYWAYARNFALFDHFFSTRELLIPWTPRSAFIAVAHAGLLALGLALS